MTNHSRVLVDRTRLSTQDLWATIRVHNYLLVNPQTQEVCTVLPNLGRVFISTKGIFQEELTEEEVV